MPILQIKKMVKNKKIVVFTGSSVHFSSGPCFAVKDKGAGMLSVGE